MSLFFLVPVGNFALVALIQCASGVGYGAISLLPRAMMADISDEERLDSRADRTGLLFALLIGTWKIGQALRSEEHTSELQSLMRISYAVFCLKKQTYTTQHRHQTLNN